MIKSGTLIEKIIENLNIFREELKSNAKLGLLNQNIHSENLLKEILNIVFKLELLPLNKKNANFPGLDLGDKNNSGTAFQITSQSDSKKIDDTLKICLEKQHYKAFNNIRFFILSNKQKKYSIKTTTQPFFQFNIKDDILDFNDLFLEIKNLNNEQLQLIFNLIEIELPKTFKKTVENVNPFDELPELILDLSNSFRIDLTDEEIEIYLIEAFHFLSSKAENFHQIKINQETFFQNRINELNISNKTISDKREIVEIKMILNELSKLKTEIDIKVKLFYHTDKYPITKSYSHLIISLKEIIEKLSFPSILIEETNFKNYFPLNIPEKAQKFQGKFKYDIFKTHKSGQTLGCSIWLSEKEILDIKTGQNFFNKISDDEFFKSKILYFSFEALHFEIDTLTTKVIPSFVDRFYDFKNDFYKFIDKDDYSSWTDLTNYEVGLG